MGLWVAKTLSVHGMHCFKVTLAHRLFTSVTFVAATTPMAAIDLTMAMVARPKQPCMHGMHDMHDMHACALAMGHMVGPPGAMCSPATGAAWN